MSPCARRRALGNFNPVRITMVSANGVQEDSISALTAGENFSATWLNSGNGRHGGGRG